MARLFACLTNGVLMRYRTAALFLGAALLLAACGSAQKPAAAPATTITFGTGVPSAAVTPVSSTPPAEWSMADAQKQYLAYVAPGNVGIDALNKAFDARPQDLTTIKAACAGLVDSTDALARQVSAGLWPASSKTAAGALVVGLTKERTGYQSCAASTTLAQAGSAINGNTDGSTAAEAMRIALGLPGN